ncbi:TPA_asm: hypothetical protein GYU64_14745, partial [Listeria monocytogenes]|nr:hypothetical protein [Listeria monocytogenes]HAB9291843.1 hypothetical protein [Listeria monocytogenes]
MFKFLIDSHSLKKLTLFNLVYRETSLNNTYLSEKISISPRSVNRYIHTLNDEIFSLCNKNDFLQVDGLTYYKINAKYSNQEALDTFYCLKLFYLKKSLSFELIVKLGTQGKTLLSDLIVELSVSASYLLRVIKKISILLQKFDFTINIDKFNRLTLSGDEKKIRTFLFTLLSDSFQNIEWPFKNISRIEIQKIMTAGSVSSLKQLEDSRKELLFAIIYTRVSSKRYIKKPDPYIEDIFNILSKTENTNIPPISANFIGQSENQAIEILYYNFMVSVFISNTLSTSWKQNIGEQIYHKNHEVIKFCKGLINAIQEEKQVQLDIADKHIELYKFVLFYVLLLDFQLDSSPFLTLTFPTPNYNFNINNSAMKAVKNIYNNYLENEVITPFLKFKLRNDSYMKFSYSIAYNFWTSLDKPKLHIYLQVLKDFTARDIIKKRISSIFNPENITFTNNIGSTDLVISDTLDQKQALPIFFIYDLQNK